MGQLVQGKWEETPGKLPEPTKFTNWLTKDGSPGPNGQKGYKAEPGRYHLYLNLGCPFAHRTHIAHTLKGLEGLVEISITDPARTTPDLGWSFSTAFPRTTGDKLFPEHKNVFEVYQKASPRATARASVPILFDSKSGEIVSAESADIVRQFSTAFDDLGAKRGDFYPLEGRAQIDEAVAWFQANVSRNYFAARMGPEEARGAAEAALKQALAELDARLARAGSGPWIAGDFSEADIHAFVVLLRLHVVGDNALLAYPKVLAWLRAVYALPGVANTVDLAHIFAIYFGHDGVRRETDPQAYGL